jgi:hypothetical protein
MAGQHSQRSTRRAPVIASGPDFALHPLPPNRLSGGSTQRTTLGMTGSAAQRQNAVICVPARMIVEQTIATQTAGLCAAAASEFVTHCDRLSRQDLRAVASPLAPATARLAYWLDPRVHGRRPGRAPHRGRSGAIAGLNRIGYLCELVGPRRHRFITLDPTSCQRQLDCCDGSVLTRPARRACRGTVPLAMCLSTGLSHSRLRDGGVRKAHHYFVEVLAGNLERAYISMRVAPRRVRKCRPWKT